MAFSLSNIFSISNETSLVFSSDVAAGSSSDAVKVFDASFGMNVKPRRGTIAREPPRRMNDTTKMIALCESDFSISLPYQRWRAPSFSSAGTFLNANFARIGTIVIATSSEASNEKIIVKANGKKNLPVIPPTNPIGRKTTTVVSVDDVIAFRISFVDCSMISSVIPDSDFRTRRKMFSMTTILSSTTRPTATAIPPSVMMFREISCQFKKIAAMSNDNGIETIAMIVARMFRKNNRTASDAKRAPSNPSLTSVATDSSISFAESIPIV